MISRARKVLDGDLKELKRRERTGAMAVEFEGDAGWLHRAGVVDCEQVNGAWRIPPNRISHQELLGAALREGVNLRRFEVLEPRLHEIFVRHAGEESTEPAMRPTGGAR